MGGIRPFFPVDVITGMSVTYYISINMDVITGMSLTYFAATFPIALLRNYWDAFHFPTLFLLAPHLVLHNFFISK